jgi:hypothetical protein
MIPAAAKRPRSALWNPARVDPRYRWLAATAKHIWPFDHGGGDVVNDRFRCLTPGDFDGILTTGSAGGQATVEAYGPTWHALNVSQLIRASAAAAAYATGAVSFMAVFAPRTDWVPGTTPTMMFINVSDASSTNDMWLMWATSFAGGGSDGIGVGAYTGAAFVNARLSITLKKNEPHVLIGTLNPVSGAGLRAYLDGVEIASAAQTARGGSASTHLCLSGNDDGTEGVDAFLYLQAGWARELSPGEVALLSRDPWAIVRPMPSPRAAAQVGVLAPAAAVVSVSAIAPTVAASGAVALLPAAAAITVTVPTASLTAPGVPSTIGLFVGSPYGLIAKGLVGGFDASGAQTLTPAAAVVSVTAIAPALAGSSAVALQPAAAAVSVTVPSASLAGSSAVALFPAAAVVSVQAVDPVLTGGAGALTAAAAIVAVQAVAPALAASGSVLLTPTAAAVAVTVPGAVLTEGAVTLSPAAAVVAVSVPNATLQVAGGPQTLLPAAATVSVTVPVPSITGTAAVVLLPSAAIVTVTAASGILTPSLVTLSFASASITVVAVAPVVAPAGAGTLASSAAIVTVTAPGIIILGGVSYLFVELTGARFGMPTIVGPTLGAPTVTGPHLLTPTITGVRLEPGV